MAFRADEAAVRGHDRVKKYLVPLSFDPKTRALSEKVLQDIIDRLGPVVDSYPSWHPLVSSHKPQSPQTTPSERTGYRGLDHTRYFAHGFITCPYHGEEDVIDSALKIDSPVATINAEILDVPFYIEGAKPVLVSCKWNGGLSDGFMVPKRYAVPLMIDQEMRCWPWAERAERWETMRPYLLGEPHGSRSSLFIDQETALALKKAYMAMVESGMFGPLKMD